MNPDQLIALIQFEQTNLERDHVYYSVAEQPEICARLIAQGLDAGSLAEVELIDEDAPLSIKMMAERLKDAKSIEGAAREVTKEGIYSHRVSVTVQGWHDVPAAIRLIRERQREFKREMGL